MNKELTDAIEKTARVTALEVVGSLKRENLIKDNKKNPFQKTEQLLYNYQNFKNVIIDKEEQIETIKANGINKKSKDITTYGGSGFEISSEMEKVEEQITKLQDSIVLTKHFIAILDSALFKISNDQYYDLIRLIYFEEKTREEIAEYYNRDITTIWRNKRRLINQLKISLFSDEVIKELFS